MRDVYRKVGSEGFTLGEVDRAIKPIDTAFNTAIGHGPITMATLAMQEMKAITIGDIGCGTGNGLKTLADEVRTNTHCAQQRIGGVGITKYDYSEHRSPATARAWDERGYRLDVTDITEGVALPDGAFHMATCYESIRYWDQKPDGTEDGDRVVAGLTEARRLMALGGTLLFNVTDEKLGPDSPVMDTIKRWGSEEAIVAVAAPLVHELRIGELVLGSEPQTYFAVLFVK